MSEPVHVLIKIKTQESFFGEKTYPHYEIGWKTGEDFYLWKDRKCEKENVEWWKEL